MFMVRVPVLSLQIVVAEPIVSHADKCLTCINLPTLRALRSQILQFQENYYMVILAIFNTL
jgi:hypothetical protein